MDSDREVIGYLVCGDVALCVQCVETLELPEPPFLRRNNILPYRQTCGSCGKTIAMPDIPELFTGKLTPERLTQLRSLR